MQHEELFVGHNTTDNHDKIWGRVVLKKEKVSYICFNYTYLTFWGRRGHKLQTKVVVEEGFAYSGDGGIAYDTLTLIRSKIKKGYVEVEDPINVYPDFRRDLDKMIMMAKLKHG